MVTDRRKACWSSTGPSAVLERHSCAGFHQSSAFCGVQMLLVFFYTESCSYLL
uniref:Uncharacterized protein n=1 Tax=Anguilla anguilla TaxID=7936 RepID=A0A0E9S7V3_ANGAN